MAASSNFSSSLTMALSSFTQYYIRKLLRQYLKEIKYEVTKRANVHRYLEVDLNQLLCQENPSPRALASLLTEIEMLVRMHYQLSTVDPGQETNLAQLEQKIFERLGLRLCSFSPSTQLITAYEEAVSSFYFFWNGELREGIQYNRQLYGLILESNLKYDLNLYRFISVVTKAGVEVVLTMSADRYRVWVDLKSPTYPVLLNQRGLLDKASKLHSVLCKFKAATVRLATRPIDSSRSEPI